MSIMQGSSDFKVFWTAAQQHLQKDITDVGMIRF